MYKFRVIAKVYLSACRSKCALFSTIKTLPFLPRILLDNEQFGNGERVRVCEDILTLRVGKEYWTFAVHSPVYFDERDPEILEIYVTIDSCPWEVDCPESADPFKAKNSGWKEIQ